MYVRVIGFDVIRSLGICDLLFIFGAIGMVAGSVNAAEYYAFATVFKNCLLYTSRCV